MYKSKDLGKLHFLTIAAAMFIFSQAAWADAEDKESYKFEYAEADRPIQGPGAAHVLDNVVIEKTEDGGIIMNPSRPENGIVLLTETQVRGMNREAYEIFVKKVTDKATEKAMQDDAKGYQQIFDNVAATDILYLKTNVGDVPEFNYSVNDSNFKRESAIKALKAENLKPEQRKQLARISQLDPNYWVRQAAHFILTGKVRLID